MKNDFSNIPQFDGFTDGLLAGAKLRALREEVAFSRLQRADFESSASFRANQRALQDALGQLELQRGQTNLALENLYLNKAESLAPLEIEAARLGNVESKSRNQLVRQQTRGAKADADVAQSTRKSRISQSNDQARISRGAAVGQELNNVRSFADTLKYGSTQLMPEDLINLAKGFGSPDEKSQAVLAQALGSEIQGMQAEYAENTRVAKELNRNNNLLQLSQLIENLQRVGDPEVLRGVFPDEVVDAAGSGITSLRLTDEQKSALSGIDKSLADTLSEMGEIQGELTPFEARIASGEKLRDRYIGADDLSTHAELVDRFQKAAGRRAFLEKERNQILGKSTPKKSKVHQVLDGYSFTKTNLNDDEIAQVVATLEAQGIKATAAEVKAYFKSKE